MPWFTKKERRRQVSAFLACFGRFPACFGRRPIRPDMADTARFWPNQPGSARIKADSARIEPHRRESSRAGANPRKKKKRRRGPTRRQSHLTPRPASDAGAAPLVPRPCFLGVQVIMQSNISFVSWVVMKHFPCCPMLLIYLPRLLKVLGLYWCNGPRGQVMLEAHVGLTLSSSLYVYLVKGSM